MLVLTRIAHVAAAFLLFGTLLIRAGIVTPARAGLPARLQGIPAGRDRLLRAAVVAAPVALLVWLFFQAADMASVEIPSAGWVGATARAFPVVLLQTGFGRVQLACGCCLLVAAALLIAGRQPPAAWRTAAALAASGAAIVLPALSGHLASLEEAGALPICLQMLHLAAAAAWLGGLPALFLTLRQATPELAAAVSRRFSPLGIACVATIAITGTLDGWRLTGSLAGLLGTLYGRLLLVKSTLLLVLLGFAWFHRQRLTPALAGTGRAATVRRFARSVLAETAVGLAVVAVAGWLASSAPALHEQPWWPLPWRFSTDVLDDPDLGPELWHAVIAGGLGLACLGVALSWRRVRWPALLLAILLGFYAQPQLSLLTAQAYPTSFQGSPTGFTAASIVAGRTLFAANCTGCHGAAGRGDGPQARTLAVPPADLTAEHLWDHSDGDLFWWIGHGMSENGTSVMPGFDGIVGEDGRWALVDYLHAHNAGLMAGAEWQRPVAAPDLALACPDGRSLNLSDLRGEVVLAAVDPDPRMLQALAAAQGTLMAAGIVPVLVRSAPGRSPAPFCHADGADGPAAYAVAAGLADGTVAGTQILIDPAGWLRIRKRPGVQEGWADVADLAVRAALVRRTPLQAPAAMSMMHMG